MTVGNENSTDRMVLGTVQLGMPYGVANKTGQPDQGLANDILQAAWEGGIRTLDTAQAYGESEAVLGNFLRSYPECPFDVITKLAANVDIASSSDIANAVSRSTERLGRKPVAMLLHSYTQLAHWDGVLGETLTDLASRGEVGCLGISVYEPDEFHHAVEHPDILWIQAPLNVFDQRLIKQGFIDRADKKGKHVFLRSIFLQGLLLMAPRTLPSTMAFASPAIEKWQKLCLHHELTPYEAALMFALYSASDAQIVIGCEARAQVEKNLKAIHSIVPNKEFLAEANALATNDPQIINPSNWELKCGKSSAHERRSGATSFLRQR